MKNSIAGYLIAAIITVTIMIGLFVFNPGKTAYEDTLVNYDFYHTEMVYVPGPEYLHKISYSIDGNVQRQCYSEDTLIVSLCKRCIKNRIRYEIKTELENNYLNAIKHMDEDGYEIYTISKLKNTIEYFDIRHFHIEYLEKYTRVEDTIPTN